MPSVTVNSLTDSLSGHVNITFNDDNVTYGGNHQKNFGDGDLTGGIRKKEEADRLQRAKELNGWHPTTIEVSQVQYDLMKAHAENRKSMGETPEGYELVGNNCVDFVQETLDAGRVPGYAADYIKGDSWAASYANSRKLDEQLARYSKYEDLFEQGRTIPDGWEARPEPDGFAKQAIDAISGAWKSIGNAWNAVSDYISAKMDDLANAKAPESTIAQYGMRDEVKNKQNNAEQTEDDIEQAQQDDDLNDQRAAEPPPPPPSSGGGGGNGPDPNPRPGCGDNSSPGDNSPPSDNGGGCSIDDSSDDVNDGWSEPIVLDLNQNGEIELTALDQSNAFYDFDGDEYLNRVGWVSGDDGFLAIDIGGDGIIELGSEIAFADFGRYAVGQLELAEEVEAYLAEHGLLNENLDFNGDGVVDVADFDSDGNGLISDLEGLRYFDSNADGVIDSGDSWECGRLARRVVVNPKYEDSAFGQMGWN